MKTFNEEDDDAKLNNNVVINIQPFEYSSTNDNSFINNEETSYLYPRHFGKNFAFLFRKGEPLIVIGPHCNEFE